MKKKRFLIIGLLVVVLCIISVLRVGERIYQNSEGQRGWSLGAAAYSAFGWGTDSYLADSAQHFQSKLFSYDGGLGASRFNIGRGGRLLFMLAVIGGVWYFFIHRKCKDLKTDQPA